MHDATFSFMSIPIWLLVVFRSNSKTSIPAISAGEDGAAGLLDFTVSMTLFVTVGIR